jgi:hypothetical protein
VEKQKPAIMLTLVRIRSWIVGIHAQQIDRLLAQYGCEQIDRVLRYAEARQTHNPPGYVVQALRQNWILPGLKSDAPSARIGHDPNRYVTGKYAAFINNLP